MNTQAQIGATREDVQTGPSRKGLPAALERQLYKTPHSFVDYLPWVEYLDDAGAVLLEDGTSVGAAFEIQPIGTEGRMESYLVDVRNAIENALQDSFDEFDVAPWVIQTYTFDEPHLDQLADDLRQYVAPAAAGSEYTDAYLAEAERHYQGIAKKGGLFVDDDVTKCEWSGRVRKNYMVIYRRLGRGYKGNEYDIDLTPVESLNEAIDKFSNALKPVGLTPKRLTGAEFHHWLQWLLNPSTDLYGGDIKQFLRAIRHDDESLPFGNAFSETLLYNYPRSDMEHKCWWFGETPMRCIYMDGIRKRPSIGHTAGEIQRGDAINAMMDQLPEGTVMVSTVVIVPQDTVELHIEAIERAAIGDSVASSRTRTDCEQGKRIMGERHKFYRAKYAFYLKADGLDELNRATNRARAILLNYGFRAVAVKDDIKALDNFITNLPMVYNPDRDRREGWRQAQLTVVQHIANLSCFFGRSRGTGNPGIVAFNRGGEPFTFDPLNPADRRKNGHMLLFGPTGAGKSAALVSALANMAAVHRPRMFIIEAGNSFGLLGEYFRSKGLSVNQVSLKPGSGVVLVPFADADRVTVEASEALLLADEHLDQDSDDESEDEQRDIMGEMEIIAQLMITGGEQKEQDLLRRSDRRLIRDAILIAADTARETGRPALTQDVRQGFYELSRRDLYDQHTRGRLREMGDAIGLFCDGFNGEVFNRPGENWPECDVTIIDLATFAREGYEAHLAISVISCLNMINNIAERDQHGAREILVTIDEAHIITTNPLLAPYLTKIVKMWRKLGAWLWLATQNLDDFPLAAKKMLNMIEWWVCLVMPKEEVNEIARFKNINDAQRALLLSASKSPKKYTEGVVFSETMETLFRIVPPSLMLSLAMTEKHEKARRRALMDEQGITEVEAAIQVAREIDEARGVA